MSPKEYYNHWFNPNHGLELFRDHRGIRSNENGILFHVVYLFLTKKYWDIATYTCIDNLKVTDGIYNRYKDEHITGSPYQNEDEPRVRTISRDNMQAIAAVSPAEAYDIVNAGFKYGFRYPNHLMGSFKEDGFYWENFQYQILWDLPFYSLMSNSLLHNTLGVMLFPIYWLIQFTIPLQKEVTRPTLVDWVKDRIRLGYWVKREKQPKNSGDQLFFVRHTALSRRYGKVYTLLISPVIYLFKKKWGNNWAEKAIFNYHDWRNHDFPITMYLRGKL